MHRHGSTAVFDIDKNIKELSILNHNLPVFHGYTLVPHVLKLFLAHLLVPRVVTSLLVIFVVLARPH